MSKVNVRVDGIFLLTVVMVGTAGYVYFKRSAIAEAAGEVVDAVNPASDKNLVFKGVNKLVGEQNVQSAADYIFGGIDLINPFNRSDAHARTVFGLK